MPKFSAIVVFLLVMINSASALDLSIQPRIIGGANAEANRWPWMVAIAYDDNAASPNLICGGSLIAKDWVLTAAICVDDQQASGVAMRVLINRPNLQTTQGETIAVKEVVIHPQFNRISLLNDIALLKLSQPSTTTPVDILPSFSSQADAGKMAVVLGWGTTVDEGGGFAL